MDRITTTRELALGLKAAQRVIVPCFECEKPISTTVKYLRKKMDKATLCLSCLNRRRSPEVLAKIASGVSAANSTPEGRERISKSVRARLDNGWVPANNLPTGDALSVISKKLWDDPEYRQKQAAGFAPVRTPEWCERMSITQKQTWRSDVLRDNNREASRRLWLRQEFRDNQLLKRSLNSHRGNQSRNSLLQWADQSFRERMSKMAADRWLDPIYRESVLARRLAGPLPSALNSTVHQLLLDMGIEHDLEKQIGPYRFDVSIPSRNLLIELNGEY